MRWMLRPRRAPATAWSPARVVVKGVAGSPAARNYGVPFGPSWVLPTFHDHRLWNYRSGIRTPASTNGDHEEPGSSTNVTNHVSITDGHAVERSPVGRSSRRARPKPHHSASQRR